MPALAEGSVQSIDEVEPAPPLIVGRSRPRHDSPTRVAAGAPVGWSPTALAGLIQAEIIPRVLAAHRDEDRPVRGEYDDTPAIDATEADAFASLVIENEAYTLIRFVEGILERGIDVQSVLVDLLAPAARHLGELWEDDLCDFFDVTMGLWRLQEIVHDLANRVPVVGSGRGDKRILLAALPGDQHSFGLGIVEDSFRRAGWETVKLAAAPQSEMVAAVARRHFGLVGLTVTCEAQIAPLAGIIAAVRAGSRNPHIGVMVGGPMIVQRPELALQNGADATAADARQAIVRAEILLEMLGRCDTGAC